MRIAVAKYEARTSFRVLNYVVRCSL